MWFWKIKITILNKKKKEKKTWLPFWFWNMPCVLCVVNVFLFFHNSNTRYTYTFLLSWTYFLKCQVHTDVYWNSSICVWILFLTSFHWCSFWHVWKTKTHCYSTVPIRCIWSGRGKVENCVRGKSLVRRLMFLQLTRDFFIYWKNFLPNRFKLVMCFW